MSTRPIPEKDRPFDRKDKFDETDWLFEYAHEYTYYKKRKDRDLSPDQFLIFGDVELDKATTANVFNLPFFKHYNDFLSTRFEWINLTEEETINKIVEINFQKIFFFPPDHGLKLIKFLTEKRDIFASEIDKKCYEWVFDNCDILDSMYIKQNCLKHIEYVGRCVAFPQEDRGTIDVVMEMNELKEPCSDELAIRAENCFNNEYGYNTFALMFWPWNIHIFKIPHVLLTVSLMMDNPMLNYQNVLWGNIFMTLFCNQKDFGSTFRRFELTLNSHGFSMLDEEVDLIFM